MKRHVIVLAAISLAGCERSDSALTGSFGSPAAAVLLVADTQRAILTIGCVKVFTPGLRFDAGSTARAAGLALFGQDSVASATLYARIVDADRLDVRAAIANRGSARYELRRDLPGIFSGLSCSSFDGQAIPLTPATPGGDRPG